MGIWPGVAFPPPRLFKIDRSYFVVDGNHRYSVGRAYGAKVYR